MAYAVVALCLVAMGAASVREPLLVLAPIALYGFVGLMRSSMARATFTVLGGLLVLQSSQGLNLPKLTYLAGVVVCFVIAAREIPHQGTVRLRLWPSGLVGAAIVMSIALALAHGVPVTDWGRDVLGYSLLAASPVLARDFAHAGHQFLARLFVFAGVVATGSFVVEWISRHRIATLPLSQFALSSFSIVAATFAYATASAFVASNHRTAWRALAVLIAAALVLTGTRTSLALVAAPIAMVLSPRLRSAKRVTKVAAVLGLVAVLLFAVLATGGVALGPYAGKALARVTSLSPSSSGTSLTGNSNAARLVVTKLAWHTFESAPLFGVGSGHVWTYALPYGTANGFGAQVSSLTLDTTLAVPAKFGAVGFAALIVFMWSLGWAVWRRPPSAPVLAIIGLFGTFAAYSVTTDAFDDKGLGLALALLFAMVLDGGATRLSGAPAEVRAASAPELVLA